MLFDGGCEEDVGHLGAKDVFRQFVCEGYTLSMPEVADACGLPSTISKEIVCSEDYVLPDHSIREYDGSIVKDHRTDVFFFGAANSGKSSLVCSVIKQLVDQDKASYEPYGYYNDITEEYYAAVMECTRNFYKATAPSSADNLLFCQLKANSRKRLTFIDSGRRGLADLAKLHNANGAVTKKEGIYRILSNDNSKMFFLLIDYAFIKKNNSRLLFEQAMMLERAIVSLQYDGDGAQHTKGCTMNKVKTLAIIITKCDKEKGYLESKEKVMANINRFFNEHLQNFLRNIEELCRKYNINSKNENKLYVFPFSLGRFTVGNTLLYDSSDSDAIASVILETCPKQLWWNC